MDNFETLWRFKTKRFCVSLAAAPEYAPDLSWDETGETAEKLESGEWSCVCFRVRVDYDSETVGEDYLGASIYANLEDFRREHIGLAAKSRADGCNYGCYFPGMIAEAIAEARKTLRKRPFIRANA